MNSLGSAVAGFSSYRLPIARPRTVCVALLGPGGVGGTLLQQLQTVLPQLVQRRASGSLVPELRILANTKKMLLASSAIDLQDSGRALEAAGEPRDMQRFNRFLERQEGPVALIDTTASAEIAGYHAAWLGRGYHVLTANKLGGCAPWAAYQQLRAAEQKGRGRYYCETMVGAGLPLIGVLEDFVRTGDEILKIEGILSGTLSHLFHQVQGGRAFSAAIRALHAEGYTEPDPRIDLSGMDVARKLVILARVAGIGVELGAIERASAVAFPVTGDEDAAAFLASCERYDAEVKARSVAAAERGCVLRYVAELEQGRAPRVGLSEVPLDHPFAHIRAGDNLVQITTARYRNNPLVIQGPGAGRDVTASGLLADLLRVGL